MLQEITTKAGERTQWHQHMDGDKLYASVRAADNSLVADCGSRSDRKAQANARLITQAPTLLTLLQRFYDATYGYTDLIPMLDFEQARNAIAAATARMPKTDFQSACVHEGDMTEQQKAATHWRDGE